MPHGFFSRAWEPRCRWKDVRCDTNRLQHNPGRSLNAAPFCGCLAHLFETQPVSGTSFALFWAQAPGQPCAGRCDRHPAREESLVTRNLAIRIGCELAATICATGDPQVCSERGPEVPGPRASGQGAWPHRLRGVPGAASEMGSSLGEKTHVEKHAFSPRREQLSPL